MKTFRCKSKIINGEPCMENCEILSAFEPKACLRTAVFEEWEIVEEPFKTDVVYALGEKDYNLFMQWAIREKLDTMINPIMTTPITWQCRASIKMNPKDIDISKKGIAKPFLYNTKNYGT